MESEQLPSATIVLTVFPIIHFITIQIITGLILIIIISSVRKTRNPAEASAPHHLEEEEVHAVLEELEDN